MPPKKAKTVSEVYQKVDQREHVLLRPGMYIGSIEKEVVKMWVISGDGSRAEQREVEYVPGLLKIFDEIVVNTLDHLVRLQDLKKSLVNESSEKKSSDDDDDAESSSSEVKNIVKEVKEIRVFINKDTGELTIYNNGNGIDIVQHDEHNVYIPELLFGNMLSSTNYDDTEERTIGGLNGIGSKATNIYSTSFMVETVDHIRKKYYKQTFSNNMSEKSVPEIKTCRTYPYTRFTFTPDYKKFGLQSGLTKDMYDIMVTRVYDMCACTHDKVKVFLNDVQLPFKNFEKYVDIYLGNNTETPRISMSTDRWEVIVAQSEEFRQISFVNGIKTLYGGKHAEYIVNQLVKKLTEVIMKKKKNITDVKPNHIKDNLFVFVKATIVNPTFDSQSKERLTSLVSKFGSKCEITDKFIDNIVKKTDIVNRVIAMYEVNTEKALKTTDGKKKSKVHCPKLDDAIWAGTAKSNECTLILCEGDSAATFCTAGLAVVGRERWGVYPLRGKVLNTKDCADDKIAKNNEIAELKKILGLESRKKYNNTDDLRYGRILIMTDADVDGSHIKGLIFNLFESCWSSLFEKSGFISTILTPIVKMTKGTKVMPFYTLSDYEHWKQAHETESGWKSKYLKGLGSSTSEDARQIFKELNVINYTYENKKSQEAIDLAFNKKRADDRKVWIANYNKDTVLDYKQTSVEYSEFINKELIHFSVYNLERSIPSVVDGMKRSQRKIIYACLKRNLTNEIKVSQLSGYVSEVSDYHHGEQSLQQTIIGVAQNFVGSNNINLLEGIGQFGSRIHFGEDYASPRYIFTKLSAVTKHIFMEDDGCCLNYLMDDDGHATIEPEYYVPTICMLLVNGSTGIATGYSTNIPCFNPKEIVRNIKLVLESNACIDDLPELEPWYRGFKGTIQKKDTGGYFSKGIYNRTNNTTVMITEAPVQVSTQELKEKFEENIEKHNGKILKDYESHYTDTEVKFKLVFASKEVLDKIWGDEFDTMFGMISTKGLKLSNMHAFDSNSRIKKYETANHILMDFIDVRKKYYGIRKEKLLEEMRKRMEVLDAKVRFIMDVVEGRLKVMDVKKSVIEDYLEKNKYLKQDNNYEYLLRMHIQSLTKEKKDELLEEAKKAKDKMEKLEKTSITQLWLDDLNVLNV